MSQATAASGRVLVAYRSLLRTINTVFRGDRPAIQHATVQARAAYRANAHAASADVDALLRDAEDARAFLASHIVQAKRTDSGRYALKLEDRHAERGHIQVSSSTDAATGATDATGTKKTGDCVGCGCG